MHHIVYIRTLFVSTVLDATRGRVAAAVSGAAILAIGAIGMAQDWPAWRGPNRNGIAADGQDPPVSWTGTHNVIWKTPVPGRGASSPTIVAGRIFLTTADEDRAFLRIPPTGLRRQVRL